MAFLPVHTILFFCCYKFAWNACNLESQVFVSPDRAQCSPTILQLLHCLCCRRVRVLFCILFAISSHSPCFPAGPASLWLNLVGWGGTLWNLTEELARGVQYDDVPLLNTRSPMWRQNENLASGTQNKEEPIGKCQFLPGGRFPLLIHLPWIIYMINDVSWTP